MQLNEDGLPARVVAFFVENPDEELTRSDIATKFDVNPRTVDTKLVRLVAVGAIVKVMGRDGLITWRKGNGVPCGQPSGAISIGDVPQLLLEPERQRPEPARPFSCALHSDGRLQLSVGPIDFTLSTAETHKLIRYLARMGSDETGDGLAFMPQEA